LKCATLDDGRTCRYVAVHTIVLHNKVSSAAPNDAPAAAAAASA
jgi:hypothetical protein